MSRSLAIHMLQTIAVIDPAARGPHVEGAADTLRRAIAEHDRYAIAKRDHSRMVRQSFDAMVKGLDDDGRYLKDKVRAYVYQTTRRMDIPRPHPAVLTEAADALRRAIESRMWTGNMPDPSVRRGIPNHPPEGWDSVEA